jgi:hypothetical protein
MNVPVISIKTVRLRVPHEKLMRGKSWARRLVRLGLPLCLLLIGSLSVSLAAATQATAQPISYSFEFGIIHTQTAGKPFEVSIRAIFANGTAAVSFSRIVALRDTTGTMRPNETALRAGNWTGFVTIIKAETNVILTAQYGNSTGESNRFDVLPDVASHFSVSLPTATPKAGQPLHLTIVAKDRWDNTVTDYNGTVLIGSTSSGYVGPSTYTFVPFDNGSVVLPEEVMFLKVEPTGVVITVEDSKGCTGRFPFAEGETMMIQSSDTLKLVKNSSDTQTGPLEDVSFAVLITDIYGNPVASKSVHWYIVTSSLPQGAKGQNLTHTQDVTDSNGEARAWFHVGDLPGSYLVEADAGYIEGSPVVFEARAAFPAGFQIFLGSDKGSLPRGGSQSLIVNVAMFGKYNVPVGIQAKGQPAGITVQFNPPNSAGNFTSVATISVGPLASYGTYPINITVKAIDGRTRSEVYEVTVEGPPSDLVRLFVVLGVIFGLTAVVIILYAARVSPVVSGILALIPVGPGLFAVLQAVVGVVAYIELALYYTISILVSFLFFFTLFHRRLRNSVQNSVKKGIKFVAGKLSRHPGAKGEEKEVLGAVR